MILDFEEINKLTLEISARYKKILDLFHKENEHILKHLAASSIHMVLFRRDLHEIQTGKKMFRHEDEESKFLNECGCKDK